MLQCTYSQLCWHMDIHHWIYFVKILRSNLDRGAIGPESIWKGSILWGEFGPGSIWTGEHLDRGAFGLESIWWGAFGRRAFDGEHLTGSIWIWTGPYFILQISTFTFTKIVLEQSYLEMIAPLVSTLSLAFIFNYNNVFSISILHKS